MSDYNWVSAVSGAAAGGCSRIVIAPLDVLKIRFQLQPEPVGITKHLHRPSTSPGRFPSLRHGVLRLWQEEGIRSFWRGNLAATWLWVLYSGVQFPVYTGLVHKDPVTRETSPRSALVCGAVASTVATVVTYPLDRIRTVLASQGVPKLYPTTTAAAVGLWRGGGVRSLYQGLLPAVVQVAPYVGLNFAFYEALVNLSPDRSAQGFWISGAEGWIAGTLAKLIVYPLDTVKRRLQFQGVTRHSQYGRLPEYSGMVDVVTQIVRHEGAVGLFKGLFPALIKSGASVGATFAFYNLFSNHLRAAASGTDGGED